MEQMAFDTVRDCTGWGRDAIQPSSVELGNKDLEARDMILDLVEEGADVLRQAVVIPEAPMGILSLRVCCSNTGMHRHLDKAKIRPENIILLR